jgi:hypothetical protein
MMNKQQIFMMAGDKFSPSLICPLAQVEMMREIHFREFKKAGKIGPTLS